MPKTKKKIPFPEGKGRNDINLLLDYLSGKYHPEEKVSSGPYDVLELGNRFIYTVPEEEADVVEEPANIGFDVGKEIGKEISQKPTEDISNLLSLPLEEIPSSIGPRTLKKSLRVILKA